jgi:hypothetical protein
MKLSNELLFTSIHMMDVSNAYRLSLSPPGNFKQINRHTKTPCLLCVMYLSEKLCFLFCGQYVVNFLLPYNENMVTLPTTDL